MEIRIEKIVKFNVCGYSVRTSIKTCGKDIGRLWERYSENFAGSGRKYGVMWYTENKEYNYLLGIRSDGADGATLLEATETVEIPAARFAAVSVPEGTTELDAWTLFFEKWLPENGFIPDEAHGKYFELYDEEGKCSLWTPVINAEPLRKELRAFSEIAGINFAPALKRLNGMQKILERVAKAAGASFEERIETAAVSLEKDDMSSFINCVHGLKSTLAQIGAEELSDGAARLETAAKAGDTSYCKQNIAALSAEINRLGKRLNEIFNNEGF